MQMNYRLNLHKVLNQVKVVSFHIITPDVFDAIENTALSRDGEVYLTDAISKVAEDGGAVACLFDGRRYDLGNKQGYLEAVVDFALRDKNLGDSFAKYLKTKI